MNQERSVAVEPTRESSEGCSSIIDSLTYTHRSVNTFTHLWVIDNFRTYIDDPDQVICLQSARFSPPYESLKKDSEANPRKLCEWQITCYPKGTYGGISPTLSLQLEYVRGEKDVKARAQFVILTDGENDEEEIEISKDTNYTIYKPGSSNSSRSLSNGSLKYDVLMNTLDKKDRLKILVKISILEDAVTEPVKYNCMRNQADIAAIAAGSDAHSTLSVDLKQLLYSEQMTDVEIVAIRDRNTISNPYDFSISEETVTQTPVSFKAHRLILAARSPVFKAMLTTPLEECLTGRIEIFDFSSNAIKSLLHFIYTGQLDNNSNPMELYRAADKYDVSDLKERVEVVLASIIEIENAAEILLLSDLHGSTFLKRQSLDFIASHTANVIASDGWKKFVACSPDLVTDVVRITASIYP